MGIAEQMGKVLQRTSISVNIKERLDFSCALFGPDGSLVGAEFMGHPLLLADQLRIKYSFTSKEVALVELEKLLEGSALSQDDDLVIIACLKHHTCKLLCSQESVQ